MPDVSVIIAAHNIEGYITRAITNALAQKNVTVEVIVVDDASTDQTYAAAQSINDPRVKCLRLDRNGGPSVARNAAIAAARGDWIAILDGDDVFADDHRLARCLALALAQSADSVVDNIQARREQDNKADTMFDPAWFNQIDVLTLERFIAGNQSFLGGSALGYLKPMFKKSFLDTHNLRYDPDIWIGEDYDLMTSVLASGARCAVDHTAGYAYTVRKGSISHRLVPGDLDRIAVGDQKFIDRYGAHFSSAVWRVQNRRTRHIKTARAFTALVQAIKGRDLLGAMRIGAAHPSALWHLWRPVAARLARLGGRG